MKTFKYIVKEVEKAVEMVSLECPTVSSIVNFFKNSGVPISEFVVKIDADIYKDQCRIEAKVTEGVKLATATSIPCSEVQVLVEDIAPDIVI